MAQGSWSIDLPGGRHAVEADFGYWSATATIRVDGRVVVRQSRFLDMGFNRGVDVPFAIDGHQALVSIRPVTRGLILITGYTFGISVDGTPAPGTQRVDPMPDARRFTGPGIIEAAAWATAGGAILGLSRRGEYPAAVLYLAAPLICSLITRRSGLSTRVMGLLCLCVVIGGIFLIATLGTIVRS